MPWFIASGSTPEGLCFDAIMKDIVSSSRGKDSYFINFSDGEPCYDSYHGAGAAKHTGTQVRKMQYEGIKVLSYFISEYEDAGSRSGKMFRQMYGKDSAFVNVESIFEVAKTMNDKFLEVA
jgi:nitric oxide reductase activation protein